MDIIHPITLQRLLRGELLTGYWFDRCASCLAGSTYRPRPIAKRIAELVKKIEADAAVARQRAGTVPLGREAIWLFGERPFSHTLKQLH